MTFEITKDRELSKRGNCVIGVHASKGPKDLGFAFKNACRRDEAKITLTMEAQGIRETIHGFGNPNLTFAHPYEIVGRTSAFISGRTIMIRADKAARDLDRRLIKALQSPETTVNIQLLVEF